jgi:hypothetical protein
MLPFTTILETASSELNHIPQQLHLSLEYVPSLPADSTDNFHKVYSDGCGTSRYWIPWTEELGAWVDSDGSNVVLVVSEASERTKISRSLTIGLTGLIAGACLNLQGKVGIHANAVSLEGLAVAFAGISGMGKSTLSTYCASRGAGFITDDVLTVDASGFAHPGIPRLKLFPHTGESLGLDASQDTDYKIHYHPEQLGATLHQRPVPLGIIYLLAESSDNRIYSEPLSPSQAVFDVLSHSYYANRLIPSNPGLFDAYVSLVTQVPVRKLFYPRDFTLLPNVYDFLLEEIHHL